MLKTLTMFWFGQCS